MAIVIKRYQNRKLYNTQARRYINLDEIAELIKDEREIKVIDNLSGEDITNITLSQIILELEKKHPGLLPVEILSKLVSSRSDTLVDIRHSIFLALNLHHYFDAEIERRVNVLEETGELTPELGEQILEKITLKRNKKLSDLESETSFLKYFTQRQLPTKKDVQELIKKIDALSQRVDGMHS